MRSNTRCLRNSASEASRSDSSQSVDKRAPSLVVPGGNSLSITSLGIVLASVVKSPAGGSSVASGVVLALVRRGSPDTAATGREVSSASPAAELGRPSVLRVARSGDRATTDRLSGGNSLSIKALGLVLASVVKLPAGVS